MTKKFKHIVKSQNPEPEEVVVEWSLEEDCGSICLKAANWLISETVTVLVITEDGRLRPVPMQGYRAGELGILLDSSGKITTPQ